MWRKYYTRVEKKTITRCKVDYVKWREITKAFIRSYKSMRKEDNTAPKRSMLRSKRVLRGAKE